MKIGRFVMNSDEVVEEVVEATSYGNWTEAETAAKILKANNADNENVCGVFLGHETSPDTYVIKSII